MSEASVLQARLVGALFVERGLLTDEQLERALEIQAESDQLLGEILVTEFEISRLELASVLAEQWAELEQEETPASEEEQPDSPRGTAASRRRIGEIFVERGFVDKTELDEALKAQKDTGQPLGEVLIGRGTLSRLDLAGALAEQWAGLEKLRPPAPKRVEGWQQVAPVEHAAATAQGVGRVVEPEVVAVVADPSLADAVSALSERVAAVEAAGESDARAGELRASVETLTARLDALDAGAGGGRQTVDEGAELRAALDELRERIDAPETRLGFVEARLNELEVERAALDVVRSRLAALEKGSSELASRDHLDGTASELATRLDGLDARLDEAASGARSGLETVVETLADVQARIDAVAVSQPTATHEQGEIAALRTQLEEIAGASAATAALTERLDVLETASAATPWRDEVVALQARLDELGAASLGQDGVVERVAAVEAASAATPWQDEVAALQARLDDLAKGGSAEGDLVERLDVLEAREPGTPWRDDLAALQEQLADLSTQRSETHGLVERVGTLEAATAGTPWLDQVAALHARLDEVSAAGSAADGLAERMATLEASSLERPWRTELRRLADELGVRLAGFAARLDETTGAGEGLDDIHAGLARLEERLEQTAAADHGHLEIAAVQARLDEIAAAGGTDELVERIAAVEAGALERPWRKELRRLADELGGRVDGLAGQLGETATTDREQLDELRRNVAGLAARQEQTATDHGHDEIVALEARVDELAAARSTVDRLAHRLAAVEAAGAAAPWRTDLSALAARLDDFGAELAAEQKEELAAFRADFDADMQEALVDAASGATARLTKLSKRVADLAHATAELQAAEEAGASAVDRSELERLDNVGKKLRGDLGGVVTRVDALTENLAAVAQKAVGSDQVETGLAAQEARLAERLAAYDEAIVLLRRRLEEIAALDGVLGERLATIEGGLSVRLDETVSTLSAQAASWREAFDELVGRLAGVEQHARSTPEALHGLHAELSALVPRLEAVESAAASAIQAGTGWTDAAAALGSRLVAVEGAVASREDERVESRLDELERGLEAEISRADERTQDTERALRKGLATLGEHLAESEATYAEAGNALRRAIDRLGQAIVETDVRIATHDDPHSQTPRETSSYVAFAPTPEGYRLIVIAGGIPEVGQTVELDGYESPLVVTRIGASPVPLDDRPCAYLERAGVELDSAVSP